jgi:hypothetical protein
MVRSGISMVFGLALCACSDAGPPIGDDGGYGHGGYPHYGVGGATEVPTYGGSPATAGAGPGGWQGIGGTSSAGAWTGIGGTSTAGTWTGIGGTSTAGTWTGIGGTSTAVTPGYPGGAGGHTGGASGGCNPQSLTRCYDERDAACTHDPRSDLCFGLLARCDELRLACAPPPNCQESLTLCYDEATEDCISEPDPTLCAEWFDGCDQLAQACFGP